MIALTILVSVLVVLFGVGGYLTLRLLRDMHAHMKAILKKTMDIDNSHGTKAHAQIIESLWGIYAALWGEPRGVWKHPDDEIKTKIERRV